MAISRRRFAFGVAAAGLLGIGYSRFVEPGRLDICAVDVRLPRAHLTSPIRILLLSDFHWSAAVSLAFIGKAIACGLKQRPDLICITGDFITAGEKHDLRQYERLLRSLPAEAPALTVLGNHDGGIWSRKQGGFHSNLEVTTTLRNAGMIVLHNDSHVLRIRQNKLTIVGIADLWSGMFDAQAAFKKLGDELAGEPAEVPGDSPPKRDSGATIVLSHNPDTKDVLGQYRWDLMLSGHTHGGQIVLPLIGAPIVPVHDRRYVAGLNSWRDRLVYTTRGVGSLYGIRFNCRPEVSILNLV